MSIPQEGWYIRKRAGQGAHLSEVYFNGKKVGRIRRLKIGIDADFPLTTLELEVIGAPVVVDIVQEDATDLVPEVIADTTGREKMTGSEASDMLRAAMEAEKSQESR